MSSIWRIIARLRPSLDLSSVSQMLISLYVYSIIRKICGKRYDGSPAFPYWRADDFDITEERFSFYSAERRLSGSKYFKKGIDPKAIVVFFHGLGDGRASYIKEICLLAKEGYLVYAYDNTGSMESQGDKIRSLDHAASDQKAFFAYLDKEISVKGLKRYAIGHSWGGWAAMMSAKKEYGIEKIVSLSGYISFPELLRCRFPKFIGFFKPAFWLASRLADPKNGGKNAINVIRRNKSVKLLYIQGSEDGIVPLRAGFSPLRKAFLGNPSIEFIYAEGSKHSPFRTVGSEAYVSNFLENDSMKKMNMEMDLEKATEENPLVWKAIFDFFEN